MNANGVRIVVNARGSWAGKRLWAPIVSLCLMLVVCAGGRAETINLLTNGSFEQNQSGDNLDELIGWTLTESNGGDGIADEDDNYSGVTDGQIVLKLNGGNNQPDAVLEQSFATVAGGEYFLSFDIGKVASGSGTAQVDVEVLGEGSTVLLTGVAGDSDGSGGRNTNVQPDEFVSYRDAFVADGTVTTLRIVDTSTNGGGNYDALLDNFVVTPEPGSSALMALFALLFCCFRPRSRAATGGAVRRGEEQ